MHVKIGKPTTWVGPYQIAEKLLWWLDKYEDPRVHEFGTWLATKRDGSETLLTRVCQWIESKKKRQVYVRVDRYDTWSMDNTLAHIITPMLKQLQATKHGSPSVDDCDVPEQLQSTSAPPKENEWDTDANYFLRWDWVLSEMIFAFERKLDDSWQDKYRSGTIDFKTEPCEWDEAGNPTMYQMVTGPNDTYKCDYEGMQREQARISNGFRLFGKYYENLWD
jgi:hypothetical protein